MTFDSNVHTLATLFISPWLKHCRLIMLAEKSCYLCTAFRRLWLDQCQHCQHASQPRRSFLFRIDSRRIQSLLRFYQIQLSTWLDSKPSIWRLTMIAPVYSTTYNMLLDWVFATENFSPLFTPQIATRTIVSKRSIPKLISMLCMSFLFTVNSCRVYPITPYWI